VVVASLAAGWWLVPTSRDPESSSIDLPGAVLSTAGLSALVYGLIEAPRIGWTSFETLGLIVAGLALMAVFALWELRNKQPMLDVRLFARPAFGVSSLTLTLVFFTLMGIFFSVAQLFQLVMGYGAFESALRMAPIFLFMMIAAPISPHLAARFGKSRVVALGLLILAAGIGSLSLLGSQPTYLHVMAGMAIMAAGMGLAMSPTTDLLMSAVPRTKAGMGSATNDTTRELGGALGVAVLGSIIASQFTSELAPAVASLPEGPRAAAESSLGGAVMVASQLGGAPGEALLHAAQAAWMSGLELAMMAGTVIVAAAAVLAFFAMPDRAHDDVDEWAEEALDEAEVANDRRVAVGAAAD
jgi:Na+/melibiose symporter-like transporter